MKLCERCGCRPKAVQILRAVVCENPVAAPIERIDQCVLGELAGAAERREAMHASRDQALDERRQNVALHAARLVQRRDEIRKDAVVARIRHRQESFDRHRLARAPAH